MVDKRNGPEENSKSSNPVAQKGIGSENKSYQDDKYLQNNDPYGDWLSPVFSDVKNRKTYVKKASCNIEKEENCSLNENKTKSSLKVPGLNQEIKAKKRVSFTDESIMLHDKVVSSTDDLSSKKTEPQHGDTEHAPKPHLYDDIPCQEVSALSCQISKESLGLIMATREEGKAEDEDSEPPFALSQRCKYTFI